MSTSPLPVERASIRRFAMASAAVLAFACAAVQAAAIVVNTEFDELVTNGACSLHEAIANADNNASTYPDCTAGSGADTITFAGNVNTITLMTALSIASPLTIDGTRGSGGNVTVGSNGGERVLAVLGAANVTLVHLDLANGVANDGAGGGNINNAGTLTYRFGTVTNGTAGSGGGGIWNKLGATLNLDRVTLAGNNGSTLRNNGSATLSHVTLSGNNGDGIASQGGTLMLDASIVANSSSGVDCIKTGGSVIAFNSLIETNNCALSGGSSGNLFVDPQLGALQDNGGGQLTFLPQSTSPVINAGGNCTDVDQRGVARPQDAGMTCDMGSVEVRYLPLTATVVGGGNVSSNPAGISNCANSCSANFVEGSGVTLTATPATGWHVLQWGNACSGIATTASVTMNAARQCDATFARDTHSVGGSIGGLIGDGLVLHLSSAGSSISEDLPVANGSTAFTFTQKPAYGYGYAVSVGTQPLSQLCSVAGGSGTMGTGDVAGITVSCVAAQAILNAVVDDFQGYARYGTTLTYHARVSNTSNVTVNAVQLAVGPLPTDPNDPDWTWTCSATGGATCGSASGNGPALGSVSFPPGGTVVYVVSLPVPAQIADEAQFSYSMGFALDVPGTILAADIDPLVLFRAGFDPPPPVPGQIVVNTEADTLTTDGLCSLREAIANANANAPQYADCMAGLDNDTITFAPNVHTVTLASELGITDPLGLTIDGTGADNVLVSGNLVTRVFMVAAGAKATMTHLDIAHGNNPSGLGDGGGIANYGTLSYRFGALWDNSAIYGSGICNNDSGILDLDRVTLAKNALTSSAAPSYGGGLYNRGKATVTHSTIAFNGKNGVNGGGIWISAVPTARLTIEASIVAYNLGVPLDCSNNGFYPVNAVNNLFTNPNNCVTSPNGNLFGNPQLSAVNTAAGNVWYYLPAAGSPVINTAGACTGPDQIGNPRPRGAACDMGSIEAL